MTPNTLEQLKYFGEETHQPIDLYSVIDLNVGAYNMILQMNSGSFDINKQTPAPNYVSPMYQSVPALVKQILAYEKDAPLDRQVTFVLPWAAIVSSDPVYVDQQQLLDDFDMQLSKDR
ncbi:MULTISPECIES: hypothetical protein [Hyphomonas]|uniref:Uncharacterized protein n=1 Tax=Hyphomonas adhaerens TaxID=81029 RepID=A0A3B9GW72_9PROT|nr:MULTISPECIES: hypothetical protein [Hyphomonas]MBB40795.1 hypothetical protein [Hyphomonas sp.]HAE26705.1 hypothetical protein [Hyphomonas adhaerens]|tara:strand:- start:20 stop:373 length:354 start_codon:yes stop_codon:yes gene_type:complete